MSIGEFAWAETFLDEAIETAETMGDDGLATSARLLRIRVRGHSADPEDWTGQLVDEADRGLPLLEAAGDHVELARALRMLAWAQGTACRYGEVAAAARRAMEHASSAGDKRQRHHAATQYALAALYGPTPVPEAIERCEAIVAEAAEDRRTQGLVMSLLSELRAMRGDFAVARDLYTHARLMLADLGRSVAAASTSQQSCGVEMLAGDPAAAERELRRDYAELEEMGEKYFLSTAAGELARAVYAQGRYAEAEELTRTAEELSAADDLTSQALWRSVRAKALAQRGLGQEAEQLAQARRRAPAWHRRSGAPGRCPRGPRRGPRAPGPAMPAPCSRRRWASSSRRRTSSRPSACGRRSWRSTRPPPSASSRCRPEPPWRRSSPSAVPTRTSSRP